MEDLVKYDTMSTWMDHQALMEVLWETEFSLALGCSVASGSTHRWQGGGSCLITLCLLVSCQLGPGGGTSAL